MALRAEVRAASSWPSGQVQQRPSLGEVGQREGNRALTRGGEGERPVQHTPGLFETSELERGETPPGGPEHDGAVLADLPRQGQALASGAQHVVPAPEVEVRLAFAGSSPHGSTSGPRGTSARLDSPSSRASTGSRHTLDKGV